MRIHLVPFDHLFFLETEFFLKKSKKMTGSVWNFPFHGIYNKKQSSYYEPFKKNWS
jgi:hypothetical protein